MIGPSEISTKGICQLFNQFSRKEIKGLKGESYYRIFADIFRDRMLYSDSSDTLRSKKNIIKAVKRFTNQTKISPRIPVLITNLSSCVNTYPEDNTADWINFILSRITIKSIGKLLIDFSKKKIVVSNSLLVYKDPFTGIDNLFKNYPYHQTDSHTVKCKIMIDATIQRFTSDLMLSTRIPILVSNLTACVEGIVSENTVDWIDFILSRFGLENQPVEHLNFDSGNNDPESIRSAYEEFRKKVPRISLYLSEKSPAFQYAVKSIKRWFDLIGDYIHPFVFMLLYLCKDRNEELIALHFSAFMSRKSKYYQIKLDYTEDELFGLCMDFTTNYIEGKTVTLFQKYVSECRKIQDEKTVKHGTKNLGVTLEKGTARSGRKKKHPKRIEKSSDSIDPTKKLTKLRIFPSDFYGCPISEKKLKLPVITSLIAWDENWLKEQYLAWNDDPNCLDIILKSIDILEETTVRDIRNKREELEQDLAEFADHFIPLMIRLKKSYKFNEATFKMIVFGHHLFDFSNIGNYSLCRDIANIIFIKSENARDLSDLTEQVRKSLLEDYFSDLIKSISVPEDLDAETEEDILKSMCGKREYLQELLIAFQVNFIPLIFKLRTSSKLDYEMIKLIMNGHRLFNTSNSNNASHFRDIAFKIFQIAMNKDIRNISKLILLTRKWLFSEYLMENFDFPLNFPAPLRIYLKEYHNIMQSDPDLRDLELSRQKMNLEEKAGRGQLFEIVPSPASSST